MEFNGVPTEGLPALKMNVLPLTPPVTGPPNPGITLDANAVVPPAVSRHRTHGLGGHEAPVG
jgi:hypothetical protein